MRGSRRLWRSPSPFRERAGVRGSRRLWRSPSPFRERVGVRGSRQIWLSPSPFRERVGVRGSRRLWRSPSPFRERARVRGSRWFGSLFRSSYALSSSAIPEPAHVISNISAQNLPIRISGLKRCPWSGCKSLSRFLRPGRRAWMRGEGAFTGTLPAPVPEKP